MIEIFSILTTLRLLGCGKGQRGVGGELVRTFSGIKAVSLLGMLLVNLGIVSFNAPLTSTYARDQPGALLTCFYAVDIWLMVSGFFLSYLLLRQYARLKQMRVVLFKVIRRFLRLWPIYALSLSLNWLIVPLMGSGPLWPLLASYPQQECNKWTTSLLMVANFFPSSTCYNWLWPLELDFQLCFIFVPMLLLYIKRGKWLILFYGIQILMLVCSLLAPLLEDTSSHTLITYFFHREYSQWNTLPFTRCGGYILGYNLGTIFY
jgi:peptidoglycan/LPS O-acetylase OafA/YrhL